MSIKKLTPLGESGELESTATFEDWVSNGWVDERVWNGRLNRQFYRGDTKINEILDRGPKAWNNSADMDTVLTRIHTSADAGTSGYDSFNEMDSGDASDEFVDIALAVISDARKVICLDQTTALNVEIFDVDTRAYDGAQSLPAASLPQDGGNEDWRPIAIVCDASNAYILFQDRGATSAYHYDHYIQAYDLDTWAVKSGWPATGLFLFDDGNLHDPGCLIFATSALLAVFDEEVTITGGASRAVILIDVADGTEDSSGAGDLSSSSAGAICSNGTHIFIATSTHIGSMTISSPATGCGGTGWPRALTGHDDGLACLGDVVVGCSGTVVSVLHTSNANIATITPADATIIKNTGRIATDGLHFWVRGSKTVGGTDRTCFVFKIRLDGLMQKDSSTPATAGEEVFECFATSLTDGTYPSAMVFDGDGLVGALDFNGSGKLWKLPKTALR